MPTTHFFRVDGADQDTGEETYLVLEAETKPQAERLARQQGLLISSVRVAKPADWEGAPALPASQPFTDSGPLVEPAPLEEAYPQPAPQMPLGPQAWVAVEEEPAPESQAEAPGSVDDPVAEDLPRIDETQAIQTSQAPAAPIAQPTPSSAAAAVVLACAGAALVLGGAVALVLAFWPDNAVRNELQQLDYRLQQLGQAVLGSMLVIAGMGVFVISAMSYLLPRCKRES